MHVQPACPDIQQFKQLSCGPVSEAEAEFLAAHLEQCDACLADVQSLDIADTLADELRTRCEASSVIDDHRVRELVARLKKMRPLVAAPVDITLGAIASEDSDVSLPPAVPFHGERTEQVYDFLAPPQQPDEIGRLGPYRVLKLLGAGGMGVVFLAEDTKLKRRVALKAMKPALAATGKASQRFLREAQSTASLKHDHVVTVYQVDEDRGVPYLAMELLQGEALDERLKREPPMSMPEVLRIGREIAEALAAAHETGLIHRDIKPANVWLEGARARVKVLDFGLARAASQDSQLTLEGAIVGTPAYMAPEQATGQVVDGRCDLFSLGCVLYRLSTGRPAFRGADPIATLMAVATEHPAPPWQVNPDVSQELSDLTMALLAKNRDDRPASAEAVVEAIRAMEAGPKPKPVEAKPARRRRSRVLTAVGVLGLLGAAAFFAAPTILRLQTDEGTLIIETSDPQVQILVTQGGKEVTVIDPASEQQLKLKSGTYELELTKGKEKLTLSVAEFTLKRGDQQIVKVQRIPVAVANAVEPVPPPKVAPPPVPVAGDDSPVTTFAGHTDIVWGLSLSADGKRLLSHASDGTVRVWEVATGKQLTEIAFTTKSSMAVQLSPDGKRVLIANYGKPSELWDADKGEKLRLLEGGAIAKVFSPDGRLVAGNEYGNGLVQWWDAESGKLLHTTKRTDPTVLGLVFTSDGKQLLSGDNAGTVRVWDVATGAELRSFTCAIDGKIGRAYFSPDAKRVMLAAEAGASMWDVETGKRLFALDKTFFQNPLAFSPDGFRITAVPRGARMTTWDAETGKMVRTYSKRLATGEVVCSPDGKHLFAAANDKTYVIGMWPTNPAFAPTTPLAPNEVRRFVGHTAEVFSLAVSADGRRVLSASADGTMRLWNAETAELVRTFEGVPKWKVASGVPFDVAFSPDGRRALSGGDKVRLWDLETGLVVRLFEGQTGRVAKVQFSPDGRRVISGTHADYKIWDAESGKELLSVRPTERNAYMLAFSPDGRRAVSAVYNHGAQVWDLVNGKELLPMKVRNGFLLREMVWIGDARRVAGLNSRVILLWDADTGENIRSFGGDGKFRCLAALPDGRRILTGDEEGVVKVWDSETGQSLHLIPSHAGAVSCVTASGDSKFALTSGEDYSIRMWKLPDAAMAK